MPTITSTAPVITSAGISVPSFSQIIDYLTAKYQGIFGSDLYLGSDTQEGAFIGLIAQAISDSNAVAVGCYSSFSPASAQGANLSSVCKINGLARLVATNSTVDVTLVGQAGTTINNGVVGDSNNNKWDLPATVTIPSTGSITVTATCETVGAVSAPANSVTQILTPRAGWQSVNNPGASTTGNPVEDDATLRQRQSVSTALPSQSILDGMIGGIYSVTGVTRVATYENATNATDSNGIPAHSVAFVVEGGDAQAIANAIGAKKSPGVGLAGTTSETFTNASGVSQTISFYRPTAVPCTVAIHLTALANYTTDVGVEIQNAVAAYINGLAIGQKVIYSRLYTPANLSGAADGSTYEITSLTLSGGTSDVAIAFNENASISPSDVTLTVATS